MEPNLFRIKYEYQEMVLESVVDAYVIDVYLNYWVFFYSKY